MYIELENLSPELPAGPEAEYSLGGTAFPGLPLLREGNRLWLPWRTVNASDGEGNLITSLVLNSFPPAGPAVILRQAYYRLLDDQTLPGGCSQAAVPDSRGGLFYLWGLNILHINARGALSWDKGLSLPGLGRDELSQYPSKVFFVPQHGPEVQTVQGFYPDGEGNALIFWTDYPRGEGQPAFRAQKIDSEGSLLWDKNGIKVVNGEEFCLYLDAVPGLAGGFIALVPADYYAETSRLDFYDAAGRIVHNSQVYPLALSATREWRCREDGRGGLYLLTLKQTGKELTLWHWDQAGTLLFQQQIRSPEGTLSELFLGVSEQQEALLGWRVWPDSGDTAFVCAARISLQGQYSGALSETVNVALQARVGIYGRENAAGRVWVSDLGQDTWVGYDTLEADAQQESGAVSHWKARCWDASGQLHKEFDCGEALMHSGSLQVLQGRMLTVIYRYTWYERPAQLSIQPAVPFAGYLS